MPSAGVTVRDDWNQHWNELAESARANPAQAFRRQLIFSLLRLDAAGPVRLLDIGSGQGDFAAEALQRFPNIEILGLELSRSGVERAASKAPLATFVQRDLLRPAEVPSQHENWATHAVCSEVLEHLDDPSRLLEAAKAYMGPDCTLVVTVPGGPMSAFDRHIGHRIHYTPGKLRSLLSGLGFNVKYAGGVGFPFFNLYRLMVIFLGKSLIDAASSPATDSLPVRVAMRVFRALFCLSTRSPLGWQIAAEAQLTATTQSGNVKLGGRISGSDSGT